LFVKKEVNNENGAHKKQPAPEFLEVRAITFPQFSGKKNFAFGPLLNYNKWQQNGDEPVIPEAF